MNILAFDTVSTTFSLALIIQDKIYEENLQYVKDQNLQILPRLDKALKECNVKLENIDLIVLGMGPGSFTAIRIAFSSVKALAYAHSIDIIGANSLDTLIKSLKTKDLYNKSKTKAAIIDAKKDSFYATILKNDKYIIRNKDILKEDFINLLKDEENALIAGDGYLLNKDFLKEKLKNARFAEDEDNIIPAKEAIFLVEKRIKERDFDNIFTLNPNYVRMSEAEYNRVKKEKEKK